jgi:hypothetical protein
MSGMVTLPLAWRLSGFLKNANPIMMGRLPPEPRPTNDTARFMRPGHPRAFSD